MLLATPLLGKSDLIADVRVAVRTAFGAMPPPEDTTTTETEHATANPDGEVPVPADPFPLLSSSTPPPAVSPLADTDGRPPADALAALESELLAVLELLLKSLSLPYSTELGLPSLSAGLLLLIAHQAGETAAGRDRRTVTRHDLRNERSDLFNGLCAVLGRLSPALMAARPWGLPITSTVQVGRLMGKERGLECLDWAGNHRSG
jgi:hypothetical protein